MTTASPYTRTAERDPLWSTLGLRPLPVSFLGGLTFRALVLVPKLRCALPDTAIIEVFPTATLRLLGVRPVVPGAKRAAKTSEAARRATQDGLARYVAGIPAVEEELLGADLLDADLLGADLLDALAAALTGVAYSRREFVAVGEPDEGQIVVPSRAFASTLAARAGERSMNDRQLAVIGEVVAIAGALGIDCWLRGGWAVDFALGRVTREHRDIDIFAWGKDIVRLAPALEHAGFEPQAGPPPDAQRDYIKDGEDVQITLLEANERGEVATAGGPFKGVAWPQGMLGSQFGRIGDVTCRIVDPRVQIEIKESWRTWRPDLPPREKDAADIARLREALA